MGQKPNQVIHSTYGKINIFPDRVEKIIGEDSFFSAIREIHANTVLCHKNIISFRKLSIGITKKAMPRIHIEMPRYYSDLYDLLTTVPLEMIHIYKFAADIFAALDCIHSNNLIHCDIKAKNILVHLCPPTAVITDFGICSIKERQRESLVQTITYRAPEINTKNALIEFTPSIDIWSVGCVLMEMILGRNLFTGVFSENSVVFAEHLYAGKTSADPTDNAADIADNVITPNVAGIISDPGNVKEDFPLDIGLDHESRYKDLCTISHDDIHSAISDIIDDTIGETRADFVKQLQRDGFISLIARCLSPLPELRPTPNDCHRSIVALIRAHDYQYMSSAIRVMKLTKPTADQCNLLIREICKYFTIADRKYHDQIIRATRNYIPITLSGELYNSFIAKCAKHKISAGYELAALSALFLTTNLYSTCYDLRRTIIKKESRIYLISMLFLATVGYKFA